MLTITPAAQTLRVHPNTLRKWANKGIIKAYRVGPRGDHMFKKEDLDHFLGSSSDLISPHITK